MSTGSRQRVGGRRRKALGSLALACAISGAAAQLLLAAGCLNPRPEELPSSREVTPGAEPELSVPDAPTIRETCEDNPLLAGCSPADDENAAPEAPAEEPDDPIQLDRDRPDGGTAEATSMTVDAGLADGDAGAP